MATSVNVPISFAVTTEILSRLPAETLVRFRLACKLWEATILDENFKCSSSSSGFLFSVCNRSDRSLRFLTSSPSPSPVEHEHTYSIENQGGKLTLPDDYCFMMNSSCHDDVIDDPDDDIVEPIRFPLIESVNGLIIVENKDSVMIHNPTTRETKRLPSGDIPPPRHPDRRQHGRVMLHYNPLRKRFFCVRFQRNEDKKFDGRIIYLEDSDWRILKRPRKGITWFMTSFSPHSSVCVDGAVYFADGTQMVRLHVSSERFEEVIQPSRINTKVLMRSLFVYKGKVAMTSRLMEHGYDRCLFTLEDVSGKNWSRVAFVSDATTRETLKRCEKREITSDGEIILVNRELKMQNEIYYYNPESGGLRVLVAEVKGLSEDEFKNEFGEGGPRAVLHANHVEHLMFLK